MAGALEGVRILDLSRIVVGPYCTMLLADLGAEVIKIEQPGLGDDTRGWGPPWVDGVSAYYLGINRNKRSLTLNLKEQRARDVLLRLVAQSDVVIENFKVGGLEAMGLGYEQMRGVNPRLVHCSITGFGPDGPYASRPGYDLIAQAMGGIMSITGEPDGEPMKVGVAIADVTTGLFAAVSILAALRHRDLSGEGQHIDCSLLESVVAWLINAASSYLLAGVELPRVGNAHASIVPYRLFQARDRWLIVACGNDRQFAALCQAVGRPALASDPRFSTNAERVAHRVELEQLLAEIFAAGDSAAWTEALLAVGVPSGPVNSIADVFHDPQVLARRMLLEVEHPTLGALKQVGFPFKLSGTPAEIRRHPPRLGEHNDEILSQLLGLAPDEIDQLRQVGAI